MRSSLATRPGRFSLAPLDRPSGLRRLFFSLLFSSVSSSLRFSVSSSVHRERRGGYERALDFQIRQRVSRERAPRSSGSLDLGDENPPGENLVKSERREIGRRSESGENIGADNRSMS